MMRPKARPEGMMDDEKKKKRLEDAAPAKSKRPKARPERIGASPTGRNSTRGINPEDNYREEDLERLTGGSKKPGMKKGGMAKKGYAKGGMAKKGYAKGGMTSKDGMTKKGYAKGGMAKKGAGKKSNKVRGAGIARKGVRPAKMV